MLINEYAELAQRTASTKSNADKIGHGCLGLIGEAGEITDVIKKLTYMGMPVEVAREKLIDELSDFWWYIIELCVGLGESPMAMLGRSAIIGKIAISERTCAAWMVRKSIDLEWGCRSNKERREIVPWLMRLACDMADIIGVTEVEVWQHNVDKLKKRYPDGFSADRSNARYEHE